MLTLQNFRPTLLAPFVLTTALVVACGKSDPPPPPGLPTASPFAKVPEPTIVPAGARTLSGGTPTPVPTPTATSTPAAEATYTVVAGDAMSLIAERFGTTSAAIRAANNLPNDDVRIGQVLKIPRPTAGTAPTPGPTIGPPRPTPPPVTSESYVVKPGDTAFGIALAFQVTLTELEEANGVPPGGLNNIKAGETIKVPKQR